MKRNKNNNVVPLGIAKFLETIDTENSHWIPNWRVARLLKDGRKVEVVPPEILEREKPGWVANTWNTVYSFIVERIVRGTKWSLSTWKYSHHNEEYSPITNWKLVAKQWWELFRPYNNTVKYHFRNNVAQWFKTVDAADYQ